MFERLIIGSSPIALLHAIKYSKKGYKTGLIESNEVLGGAWSIHKWDKLGYTEKACHLIEYYDGIYELIESISGHNFLKLEPQPFKMWNNGKTLSYSSKKWFLFQFLKLVPISIIQFFIKLVKIVLKLEKPTKNFPNSLLKDFRLLIFLFKYRILSLHKKQYVKGPEGGWLAFTDNLIKKLEDVEIITGTVTLASEQPGRAWKVVVDNSNEYSSNKLIVTESFNSELININNQKHISYLSKEIMITNFYHILVSVDDIFLSNQVPYVHFVDNDVVKRVTPLHSCGFGLKERGVDEEFVVKKIENKTELLVQLRKAPENIEGLQEIISYLLLTAGITNALCPIAIHDYFKESGLMVGNENFLPGIYNNLIVLKSVGDLGISVLHQKETLC